MPSIMELEREYTRLFLDTGESTVPLTESLRAKTKTFSACPKTISACCSALPPF